MSLSPILIIYKWTLFSDFVCTSGITIKYLLLNDWEYCFAYVCLFFSKIHIRFNGNTALQKVLIYLIVLCDWNLEEKKTFYLILFSGAVSDAQTLDVQKGAALFRKTCIGCHDAGGNIIQPVSLHLSVNLIYSFIPQNLFLILIPLFPLLSRVQHSLLKIYRGNRVQSQSNILLETCIWTRISF